MSLYLKGHQRIQFSTGSILNSAANTAHSRSFHRAYIEVDPNDGASLQIRIPSESFGGDFDRIAFYVSSSGRIGVGTQDPQTAFDVRDIGEDTEITSSIAKAKVLSLDRTKGLLSTNITASGNISASGTITAASIATDATFTVAQGGTGASSFADKAVIITQDSGTDTLAAAAMSTNGQLLIGGTNGPAVAVPTGGDGLSVTVGDGTLEYDLDAALTTVTSILATDIKIGEDDQTKIDFETEDEIHFYAANVHQVKLVDNAFTPQADSDVDLGASGTYWKDAYIDTVTTTGDIDVLGNIELGHASDTTIARASAGQITVEGTAVLLAGAQTGITSLLATDIKIGEDNETKIDFETADEIHFYANNVEQVYLADNIFGPESDSDVDLGTTGVRWKDAYIDTVTTTTVTTTTLDAQYRHFDTGSSKVESAGGSIGDIVKFGGSTTTAGKIYYLKHNGTWGETNVTASLEQGGCAQSSSLSIAVALGTNSDTNGMLLRGMAHLASDPEAEVGKPLFLSTESGSAQSYAPTGSGEIVRIVGHQMSGSGIIYFNPSPDFIEVS